LENKKEKKMSLIRNFTRERKKKLSHFLRCPNPKPVKNDTLIIREGVTGTSQALSLPLLPSISFSLLFLSLSLSFPPYLSFSLSPSPSLYLFLSSLSLSVSLFPSLSLPLSLSL
jgi:hypothetical protein